ncbi:MAG: heme o synthase [Thiotrichales bacterium]|nr:heme o synthase [Thiotrichales bacterium]
MGALLKDLNSVFKLRIGFAILFSGLAGMAITAGEAPGPLVILVFSVCILMSSASAGAFNQYIERDLDARMKRTRQRPFVTGRFRSDIYWPLAILFLLVLSVGLAAVTTNTIAALYLFLGAFTYGVVYTVWLKRKTWLNIVIGGLSGSFAVLAGAAVINPSISVLPMILAVVLFLWTPPHFWSLAFVFADDYRQAGVPMLPVVVEKRTAAIIIFLHTLALTLVSILPVFYGLGWIYLAGALGGGAYFLTTSFQLVKHPDTIHARKNFHASLLQLSLLLIACMFEAV